MLSVGADIDIDIDVDVSAGPAQGCRRQPCPAGMLHHTDGAPPKWPPFRRDIHPPRDRNARGREQESSVPGRLARLLTERLRRRAGHVLCRLQADERPIMPSTSIPAAGAAIPPATAPGIALPDTGFLRQARVLSLVPISKSTLWRRVHARTFPEPVKLSERVTAWRAEDIRRWIEQQGVRS